MSVQEPQKKLGHVERHREEACEGDRWRQHVEGAGRRGAFEGGMWRRQVEGAGREDKWGACGGDKWRSMWRLNAEGFIFSENVTKTQPWEGM